MISNKAIRQLLITQWIRPVLDAYGFGAPAVYSITWLNGVGTLTSGQLLGIKSGDVVTGAGIPAGTTVSGIDLIAKKVTVSSSITGVIETTFTHEEVIKVISSHNNAPAPQDPYIVVSYSGSNRKQGRATLTPINNDGERLVVHDNEITNVDIMEYGEYEGYLLDLLVHGLDLSVVRDNLMVNKMSVMVNSGILPAPSLVNDDWQKSAMVEVKVLIASSLLETVNNIENVEFTGDIS